MSSQAAPTTGQFQSQSSTRPSAASSRLSSRMSVCTSVSPPATSAKRAASAAASSRCSAMPGRSGGRARTWSQYAGQVGELVGERRRAPAPPAAGVRAAGHLLGHRQAGVQVGGRHGRRGRPRLDVLDAEHDPVVVVEVPEQPRRGRVAGQRRQLAGLLAVGLGERSAAPAPRPPSRSAASRPRRSAPRRSRG